MSRFAVTGSPVPCAEALEDAWMPSVDRIAAAVRRTVGYCGR